MKNTRFQTPDGSPRALATTCLTVTGYAPIRRWALVPMTELPSGEIVLLYGDACKIEPLPYAGSRAEVAACLLQAGYRRMV